ncbi:hypothetical protein QW71_09670 [Paenibacillus sp. IHB B 3415]|uniref:hypothetical protein n=1 Tax=Paenibacillus sp. IHB B 3415 TaxID=867080 RepID=UPI000573A3B2|nr:hypothetical protein [Paenibacillus sp. IHB B 3415]KHL95870.1 hypothetical protein QW71_09670 [Paenibacillus sp. IHB B 3415]
MEETNDLLRSIIETNVKMLSGDEEGDKQSDEATINFFNFFICTELFQQQQIKTLSIKEIVNKLQETDDEESFSYDYDRFHERIFKVLKSKGIKKSAGFIPQKIKSFQLSEIKTLAKETFDNKTHKRMRTNNFQMIKFDEFREFVEILQDDLKDLSTTEQLIQKYKIERSTNFEILMKILDTKKKLDELLDTHFYKDLLLLTQLPNIEMRAFYADHYLNFIKRSMIYWRKEVASLPIKSLQLTNEIIDGFFEAAPEDYQVTEKQLEKAVADYLQGKYKVSDDLSIDEKDFKKLMEKIRELNIMTLSKTTKEDNL